LRNRVRAASVCVNTALFWLLSIGLTGCLAIFGGYPAGAAPQDNLQLGASLPSPSIGGILLRLVLSLVIVIGLMLVLVKLLQKNNLLSRQSAWAKIVDQVAIGPNRMLVLAEIFGKVYVLGVTDHNITTLLGENEIDLSEFRQVVADAERKRGIPSYFNKPFLQILESKLQDLKRSYPGAGKGGRPR